jgi:hypothetical protein
LPRPPMSPVMVDDAIEGLAERLLERVPGYIWDGERLPVPVEDIVDSFTGLLVRDVEDLRAAPGAPALADGQTLSGLLLPASGEIWVDADEARQWPARRRFTIAHELGHWEMHRHGGHAVYCRSASVTDEAVTPSPVVAAGGVPSGRPPLPRTEEEANAFAAALLMPARLIREHYAQPGRDFTSLCATFGASGAAMGRRLHAVIERAPR